MKAISAMIATVLLIAFTIGVGGLISIFVTGLTTTSTGITSNQSESLTRCAGAWINVFSVQNTTVLYSNPTSQNLTSIVIVYSGGATSSGASSLAPGASASTSVGPGLVAGGLTTQNTSIIVRALCLSTVTVEGKCANNHECWDI